ncbi:MAG: Uma2 family endonuclease, partial [Cyanobacteria bacterium J06588_5]
LIVNPPTGWETGERNFSLAVELGIWLRSSGIEGKAFDSSTGFILPNGATRSPDISWISQARWASLSDEQKSTFASVCPEFVIELRSSSDRLKPIQEKMQEYIDNGAKLGWLINPQNRQVEIYRNGLPVEILDAPSELSGEQVLPGFVLNPNLIWS